MYFHLTFLYIQLLMFLINTIIYRTYLSVNILGVMASDPTDKMANEIESKSKSKPTNYTTPNEQKQPTNQV